MVKIQGFNGEWTLCRLKTGETLSAKVPGERSGRALRGVQVQSSGRVFRASAPVGRSARAQVPLRVNPKAQGLS